MSVNSDPSQQYESPNIEDFLAELKKKYPPGSNSISMTDANVLIGIAMNQHSLIAEALNIVDEHEVRSKTTSLQLAVQHHSKREDGKISSNDEVLETALQFLGLFMKQVEFAEEDNEQPDDMENALPNH